MSKLSTERAIDALDTVRAYYASLTAGYPKGKDCKAIGDVMCSEIANSCLMAIKALEQEPCKGTRDIRKAYKEGYDKGWSDGNFIGANRWITVGEKLPEKRGFYLVSTTDCITIMEFINGWISQNIGLCNRYVKAWMPLPQAYREVEG